MTPPLFLPGLSRPPASLKATQMVVEGLHIGEDTHRVRLAAHHHHILHFDEALTVGQVPEKHRSPIRARSQRATSPHAGLLSQPPNRICQEPAVFKCTPKKIGVLQRASGAAELLPHSQTPTATNHLCRSYGSKAITHTPYGKSARMGKQL